MNEVSDNLHFRYTIGGNSLEFFQSSFHTVCVLSVFFFSFVFSFFLVGFGEA